MTDLVTDLGWENAHKDIANTSSETTRSMLRRKHRGMEKGDMGGTSQARSAWKASTGALPTRHTWQHNPGMQ